MKAKLDESKWWVGIELSPESMQEVASLLRLAMNTKREVPVIHVSFSEYSDNGGVPTCLIQFDKKQPNNQISSVNNRKK